MTSKKTRSKYKKARFLGRMKLGSGITTNSEPVKEEFPIQQATVPNPSSEYVIEDGGPEADTTPIYLQRFPWLVDLPLDKLEKGQSFLIPFDKFHTDPVVASSRSFNAKMVERARGNLRMYIEADHKHLSKEIGTKTLKEKDALKVFRRTDVKSAAPTSVPSAISRAGKNRLLAATRTRLVDSKSIRPTLTAENRVRILALAKDYPHMTVSGIVNDMIDIWFNEESNDE